MLTTKKTISERGGKLQLNVTPRTVFGKKLKKLRREGNIPANIYGPDYESKAVTAAVKDFTRIYKTARETGVVYLKTDSQELPVLIKNVQTHPVSDLILHVDFRKIDLKQKIQTDVPVKIVGQSEAVAQKGGVLLTQAETLLVEALPIDIPKQIEVDISKIKEIGQEIKVSDLAKSDKYEVKDLGNKVIVSVVEHKEEEILPQTAPVAAPEVITAKPEEGAIPTEGEAPAIPSTSKPTAKPGEPATIPSSAKATEGKPEAGKKTPPFKTQEAKHQQPAKPAEGKK